SAISPLRNKMWATVSGYRGCLGTSPQPSTSHRHSPNAPGSIPSQASGRCSVRRRRNRRQSSAVDVLGQGRDEGHIAVLLRIVESVADDELVGHVEADVLDVDVDLDGFGLAQHGADLDGG